MQESASRRRGSLIKVSSGKAMRRLFIILNTIKYLRPIQIRYQLWFRFRKMWRKASGFKYPLFIEKEAETLKFTPWIDKPVSYQSSTFTFLNQSIQYTSAINWGESKYGRLWAYNLNYMDYLLQPNVDIETENELIARFISDLPQNPTGLEPYPIALRGINWIKFLSKNAVIARSAATASPASDGKQAVTINSITSSLYAQYLILLDNLEYHLMGNHLLEDAFSVLFGAYYFKEQRFWETAKRLLTRELEEQLLDDGAHFELSPMYHQILLDRLLDCINLMQNNRCFEEQDKLLELLEHKAEQMLTWLNNITLSNGDIPLLNDSAPGIAPTTQQLNDYARRLNINVIRENSYNLCSSGYRRFDGTNYECILDVGPIGPSYQPGHAHADTFNFVLNVKKQPVLVDTGISTYEANVTRLKERGTAAHNTVTINNENSSEVWSSFRVARRATVQLLKEEPNHIIAEHSGYKKLKSRHQREWIFSEDKIKINDYLDGKIKKGKAHFWLPHSAIVDKTTGSVKTENTTFTFKDACSVNVIPAKIANGYNCFLKTHKIEVTFKERLNTLIMIH